MAHFAELDEANTVVRVIVVGDEHESEGEDFCHRLLGGRWKQTSYNTRGNVHQTGGVPFRKNYAGIGYTYDAMLDGFIPPQPFPSWNLNTTTGLWEAPIPYPTDGQFYRWDETAQEWILVE